MAILYKASLVVAVLFLPAVCSWDSEELELFDLVEEVNTTFYELLDVPQSADSRLIRQAFKKLSLVLHPDKSDAPDAEVRFRQLVAVHEVLRDPSRRRQYDDVLENGLPDWRHAVYYYRRVRKMGLLEMGIILFVIVTIGQYITAWAAYLERKVIVEEYVATEKKRLQKKQKKGKLDEMPDLTFNIPKPSVKNTLPFQIPKFLWVSIMCIPVSIKFLVDCIIEKRRRRNEVDESSSSEEEIEQETFIKGPRRRRTFEIPEFRDDPKGNGCLLDPAGSPESEEIDEKEYRKPVSGGLWTDDDLTELVKLVNKFPQGTAKRWEKIASAMGRTVSEVTHMSKKIKENMVLKTDASEDQLQSEEPKKIKTRGGKLGLADEVGADKDWSQIQQKALEEALSKYPKQTGERWEKISKSVPGKSKEECMLRFKLLHEIVKKKKEVGTD